MLRRLVSAINEGEYDLLECGAILQLKGTYNRGKELRFLVGNASIKTRGAFFYSGLQRAQICGPCTPLLNNNSKWNLDVAKAVA